jgi:integrase
MMKSIRSRRSRKLAKPKKPRPDFPLFPHATKRWAKKIKGKLCYFGPWADPEGALTNYLDQKDDLYAGRVPRKKQQEGLRVRELSDRFLSSKRRLLDAEELSPRTFADYYDVCKVVVNHFKPDRLVPDLTPAEFEGLLDKGFPKTWGPVRRVKVVQITRSLFKFASDEDLIDRPIKFGKQFRGPSKKTLRLHRAKNGKRMFGSDGIRAMVQGALVVGKDGPELVQAGASLVAMILLGANCGFGNNDVSTLPLKALDLDGGWVDFPRPKTGIERRCKLWPETVAAVRTAIAQRPSPKDDADAEFVFITRGGTRWSKVRMQTGADGVIAVTEDDALAKEFAKLLRKLGLKKPGLNFYTLRRVFETVGGESLDQVAVDHIMGHAREDMASVYRQRVADERIEAVVEHVRAWLFGENRRD